MDKVVFDKVTKEMKVIPDNNKDSKYTTDCPCVYDVWNEDKNKWEYNKQLEDAHKTEKELEKMIQDKLKEMAIIELKKDGKLDNNGKIK